MQSKEVSPEEKIARKEEILKRLTSEELLNELENLRTLLLQYEGKLLSICIATKPVSQEGGESLLIGTTTKPEEIREETDDAREAKIVINEVNKFCQKYNLSLNVKLGMSAREIWKEINKAYHAKLWETTNDIEGEPDLHN